MMPTRSESKQDQTENSFVDRVFVVPETCPEYSTVSDKIQDKDNPPNEATPDSKTLSYDVASSSNLFPSPSTNNECTSPPTSPNINAKNKSVSILATPDRDFIHMLIQESYNMIDSSNANTVKELTDKVKRKEAQLIATYSKALSSARDEVIVLQNERNVLQAQLDENRKYVREVKSSASTQVLNIKQKCKLDVQKLELELTKVQKEKSDYISKRNSASVTHDLKHEKNEHRRTKEHLNLVISNKDGVIKDLKASMKNHSDKIVSLENEIKSLNKELRAFGKSIAQEELKINGRLRLQGNKRRAEEKTMRSKIKKRKEEHEQMVNEVNNAMFAKKFDYNNKVSSIVNNFKEETYHSPSFLPNGNNMMFHGAASPYGSPFGNSNISPMNMFPSIYNDPRFNAQFNLQHDPDFGKSERNESKQRLRNVIAKAKHKANRESVSMTEIGKKKEMEYNSSDDPCSVDESVDKSPVMLTVPSDDETVMNVDDVDKVEK